MPPGTWNTVWSWVMWVGLLAAVPVQAVVIGEVNRSSINSFRSVGSAIRPAPGSSLRQAREAAGDAANAYLDWLPLTQIVMAGVAVVIPFRPVRSALRRRWLWVWVPVASFPFAWFCSQGGQCAITTPPL